MVYEPIRSARLRAFLTATVVVLLLGNAVALSALEPSSDGSASAAGPQVPVVVPGSPDAGATATTTGAAPGAALGTNRTPPTKASAPADEDKSLPESTSYGEYRFDVTVSPRCVVIGAPITVTMHLQPGDGAIVMVVYSDGTSHGSRGHGHAGADGLFTYTGPAAGMSGDAAVLTSAISQDNRTGATRVHLRVIEATGTCP